MISDKEKARLTWHCRRGMLELDLILHHFLQHGLDQLNPEQLKTFDLLLGCTDPELFSWLMGHSSPKDEQLNELVHLIKNDN